jgi:hypothetical protein
MGGIFTAVLSPPSQSTFNGLLSSQMQILLCSYHPGQDRLRDGFLFNIFQENNYEGHSLYHLYSLSVFL